jgi:Predicted metal-dependent hydrolase
MLGYMLINNFDIEVNRKQVKNINLKVYPDLTIKASIPENMDIATVERMIISKEDWINNQLKRYEEQNRMTKRSYVSGEDHYLNGKRYILKVCDSNTPMIKIENNNTMMMYVRKSSSVENKERLMNCFYKENLENKLKKFIPLWEDKIGVKSNCYSIRKMKNKWGSCNTDKKEINFNLELAKKKDSEIQYVVIHELLHLIERNHNEKFRNLMYSFCPKWELYQETLNEIL